MKLTVSITKTDVISDKFNYDSKASNEKEKCLYRS